MRERDEAHADVGLGAIAPALVLVLASACQQPAPRPTPVSRTRQLTELVGGWRWQLRTVEAGTTRIEQEAWRIRPTLGVPGQLSGRYLRDVEVRSDDRVPFACNQRPWYRQRAVYDVEITIQPNGYTVREIDYHAEPTPCDHGFRRLGAYTGQLAGARFTLQWDGGSQTLWQTDAALADLPISPWPSVPELTGAWRWDATSYDDHGDLRDESEWWELTRRTDDALDGTYRRRVTVRSPDGSNIACAGAPSWSFDEAYVLVGKREEQHWRLQELATDPAQHPCLAATPRRNLDEATAEQIGDFVVLEWRGKRRQVLYRPE